MRTAVMILGVSLAITPLLGCGGASSGTAPSTPSAPEMFDKPAPPPPGPGFKGKGPRSGIPG